MVLAAEKKLLSIIVLAVSFSVTVFLFNGCADDAEQSPQETSHIVVMGTDGLEWNVIIAMLEKGKLPNLAALIERGACGSLRTLQPTVSPVIWTSIATGKGPKKHGIESFTRRGPSRGDVLLNSTGRKTKALWNILSDCGKTVWTIGWWMTYPVEEVSGVMVAQTNTSAQLNTRGGKNIWKGALLKGVPEQVYPPERQNEMITILEEVEVELPNLMEQVFGRFRFPLSSLEQRLWENCRWAFRADATYERIVFKLAEQYPPADLTLLYFGGPDVVSHRFWRYMQPEVYKHKPTPEQIENFGTIIEDYYAYTDNVLGQLLEAYGPDTTFIVVSDHGFHAFNRNADFDPNAPAAHLNSGAHVRAPDGIFIAAGPGIRRTLAGKSARTMARSNLPRIGSMFDIAPTILAMLRIPVGKDMDGQVMTKIFHKKFKIAKQPPHQPV